MPDSFISRLAAALGVNGNGDMRVETHALVRGALAGDEDSRRHLRDLIDAAPAGYEAALRDAAREVGLHGRTRLSAPRPRSSDSVARTAAEATPTDTEAAPSVSPHWETRETYEGDQGEVVMQPLRLYEPETLEDLVFIVKKAEELGHTVKAVGAGCSYSGVNQTSGLLVDTHGLDAMLPIDNAMLWPGGRSTLCRFQAGARLDQISERLAAQDRALENMGGFLQLSFVGAATVTRSRMGTSQPSRATWPMVSRAMTPATECVTRQMRS